MYQLRLNYYLWLEESVASDCMGASGCPWLNWSIALLDLIIELTFFCLESILAASLLAASGCPLLKWCSL